MLLIHCPYCGENRDEQEFSYAGEAFIKRPDNPAEVDDATWADYLFNRKNPKGWHDEQWVHSSGCRKFFVVRRHTASNRIDHTRTYTDTAPAMEN